MLKGQFQWLDGNKAVGIDRVTKVAYGEHLDENISNLIRRIRKGTYRLKVARITEIPKEDGSKRPCFHCQACRRYFQVEYRYNGHKSGTAQRIVDMVFNASGVRDPSRVLGISKDTVIRLFKKISPRPGEQSTASYC